MNSFSDKYNEYSWQEVENSILGKTRADVEHAINKKSGRTLEDFKALVSPAATGYLEELAFISHRLTRKRFGNTIQLYTPIYLSNECQNICTYCAFSQDNKIKRITLNKEQLEAELMAIKQFGFDHILIVTGESSNVDLKYFKEILPLVRSHFSHISFEVQPLEIHDYRELILHGVNTVLVYQETYNAKSYPGYHPKGKKLNFNYRINTPDRLGRAGIHKIGLGILLGLDDWRVDSFFCALHLAYLEKTYWRTKYSISFPRLRPIELAKNSNGKTTKTFSSGITDRELVQLICAYRLFNEEIELSISTRESETFRDNIFKMGITTMSAGSKTNPGGYSINLGSLEQFEISDERPVSEIDKLLRQNGYEPLYKDWDRTFQMT